MTSIYEGMIKRLSQLEREVSELKTGELNRVSKLTTLVDGSGGGIFIGTDTQLYRSAANVLRTPDTLVVDGDLYTTAFTDYSATSTIVGWASFTTKEIFYKQVGKLVFVIFNLVGTSNSVSTSITVPVSCAAAPNTVQVVVRARDNSGVYAAGLAVLGNTNNVIDFYSTLAGGAWTATQTKAVLGEMFYEAA